jgi:hypothetical protein
LDDLLFYPSRRGSAAIFVAIATVVVWAAVILIQHGGLHHLSFSDGKMLILAPLILVAYSNRWRQVREKLPRLRVSPEGIEGRFGRVAWSDVESVDAPFRWNAYAPGRRIVIHLRPGARIEESTGEFAGGPGVGIDRVRDDRVELASGGFDRPPGDVAHAIRQRAPAPLA